MKIIRDNRRSSAKQWHSHTFILSFLVILICVLLLFIVGGEITGRVWGQTISVPKPEQQMLTTTDPVTQQLIERVNDGMRFLHTTVVIVGALVTLLSAGAGYSIWQTRKYALNLLEEHVLEVKRKRLDPALKSGLKELQAYRAKGLDVALEASSAVVHTLFEEVLSIYKTYLAAQKLTGKKREQLLNDKQKSVFRYKFATRALLRCLREDDSAVQGACQDLAAVLPQEAELCLADPVLEYMRGRLNEWEPGTTARKQIQNVIEIMESYRKNPLQ